ncbi:MAG: radical SAM protein [Methanomassiliicoccales archaeon]|nr:MAG: radical SAM protein [Methanomassiliicoccales archaeon]
MKINEIFYSIQGEGELIGVPTIFIRTSGCNLRCSWCDTKYAYEEGHEMSLEEILKKTKEYPSTHICITGGEPLLQKDIIGLVQKLSQNRYQVSIETNGSKSIEELPCLESLMISMDIKCPSSGMQKEMDFSNLDLLSLNDQLKFVIGDRKDYEYAKKIIAEHKPLCSLIMMPVSGTDLQKLADWVLEDGLKVRVLPQLHKLIWSEKKGV